jgi:competence protein ComEC
VRLPALAIAAAFACGIALGLWLPAAGIAEIPFLWSALGSVCACGAFALLLLKFEKTGAAAGVALLTWAALGLFAAAIEQQPLPTNHVLTLAASGALDLHEPLRWRGALASEPVKMPWGWSYDVALAAVEYEGRFLTVQGGMRLSYAPEGESQSLAELHAGDQISVLTQARRPQFYRDEGAFDRRAFLEQQGVDVVATLRAPELMERTAGARRSPLLWIGRMRTRLREELDRMFANAPEEAGILRAMLLGDRSFIERREATDFQKTGVFHVLVVAGLHVGAFAAFLFWLGRRFRVRVAWTACATAIALCSYVALIEQRPPVLRATLMALIVLAGMAFFRRLDLVNSAAVAGLVLLIARPLELRDSSFQLSFLAIGCIAGIAVPYLERSVEPYARAIRSWHDVARDASHSPRAAEFRIDLRNFFGWVTGKMPKRVGRALGNAGALGIASALRMWEIIVLTVVLQIGMLPLLAGDFHRVTLSGPLANLVAVPLTGVIVPLGFVTLAGGFVFPLASRWVAVPLGYLAAILVRCVEWFAHSPRLSYRIPGPPLSLVILFFVVAVVVAVCLRLSTRVSRVVAFVAAGLVIVLTIAVARYPFAPRWSHGKLELTVLDVGQGDALFVVSPKGHTLLIDGGGQFLPIGKQRQLTGPDPGEEAVSPYLWSRGYKRIDVVALTHAHQDHLGGLTAVLENFRVGALWIGREADSPGLDKLKEQARLRGIPIVHERQGAAFDWGGVEAQFLWPRDDAEQSAAVRNSDSLVLRLQFGNRAFLLPGDAEQDAEQQILADESGVQLHSDVLKVGHHGSKNATSPAFLAAVQPEFAIISSGEDNPYGLPSPELLARLESAPTHILRTDTNGAVHVLTDGETLDVSCFLGCAPFGASNTSMETQPPNHQQHN